MNRDLIVVILVALVGLGVVVSSWEGDMLTGAAAVRKQCKMYCYEDYDCYQEASDGKYACGTKVWSANRKSNWCFPLKISHDIREGRYCKSFKYDGAFLVWGNEFRGPV